MTERRGEYALRVPGEPTSMTLAELLNVTPEDEAYRRLVARLREFRDSEREAELRDAHIRLY